MEQAERSAASPLLRLFVRASLVFAVLCAGGLGPSAPRSARAADPNPIVVENQQPGSASWQMRRPGYSVSNDTTGQVKGYASATSVPKGGQIDLMVSVNPAQSYTVDVYRMGYYGGLGGRLMTRVGPLQGSKQRTCTPDPTTGVIDCAWTPGHRLSIPTTWTSGVYLAQLTNSQNYQNYITFVVRDDARQADFLYQQSVTTYQAYNNYPDDGSTGKSLYDFNSRGAKVPATNAVRAAKVSFDRPYADRDGSGQFLAWEVSYIRWLESAGYDVTYSTNVDTHTSATRLLSVKGFLSVGHDEYWSKAMLDGVTAARDAGVGLGFFGSNTAYWQIRFEPSAAGVQNRVVTCYKSTTLDPVKDSTATGLWRDPPASRPEQGLVGVQYTAHLKNEGSGAMYVVKSSNHWVWAGTGVSDGTQIPGILGYETDRLESGYPPPVSQNYTVLAESPVVDTTGRSDIHQSSIYQAPSGAWVFASGSNYWSNGLGRSGSIDPRVQRATSNLLNRFLADVSPPPPPPPDPSPPAAPSGAAAVAVSSSQVDLSWVDNSSDESGFVVERSPTGTSGWAVVAGSLTAGTTSYRDSGLSAETAYWYRVKAVNAAGSSAYSAVATVTTPAATAAVFAETFPGADGTPWDTTRWATDPGSAGVADIRGGAGRLRFENVSGARVQAVAKAPKVTDSDLLVSVRFGSTSPRGYLYVYTRASGDWVGGNPSSSYFLQLMNNDSAVNLWRSTGGTTTTLVSRTGVAAVTTAKQWVRLRTSGTSITAKIWTDGTPEPTTWELTATDTAVTTAGVPQLKWARSSTTTAAQDVHLDDLTVTP